MIAPCRKERDNLSSSHAAAPMGVVGFFCGQESGGNAGPTRTFGRILEILKCEIGGSFVRLG
jgi:hypothetical protein